MTKALDPLALVGTTVSDKYQIEQVADEGGFAIVYRATHNLWKRPVAIKVFRTMGDLSPERREQMVQSFIQEGALLAELSERSAAIVQARDVGILHTHDSRDMPYMVLEWLEGLSLEKVLEREQRERMPARAPLEALQLLEPAAMALTLAHRKGIAHRDIKPANIFVLGDPRADYTIKLLDFGIAKVVQDMQRLAGSFAQTQGIVSSFTPAYGAPEQFSRTHGATGPWTDVFALALIYTELVTQVQPLRGDDLTQLAFCSIDPKKRPTPRTYGADVPDELERVLAKAVAVNPNDRFPSMGEFWDALRDALGLDPISGFADSQRSVKLAMAADSSGRMRVTGAPQKTMPLAAAVSTKNLESDATISVPNPTELEVARKSTAKLFIGGGIGMAAAAAAIALGVWTFVIRGHEGPLSSAGALSATVSAPAPAANAPLPETTCPDGMTKIAGGKFFMGSDDKNDLPAERPAHQVTLTPYCIDTFEVTVARYKECSDRGECKRAPTENDWPAISPREHKIYDPLCNIRDPVGRATYPINCVDWQLATAFCRATDGRLPTEAEWEFATRGSDGRKYPWGDDPPGNGHLNACGKECLAWGKRNGEDVETMYMSDDGFATTAPVGSFPNGASPFGLQDVVGNVWEWASDWFDAYGPEPVVDPKGPASGKEHVLRGGAWNGGDAAWVRPTYRFKSSPTLRSHGIGFRCVRELVTSDR